MIRILLSIAALNLCLGAGADEPTTSASDDFGRVVYEVDIDADLGAVWTAFTTVDGLKSWMAPVVDIELTVGGKMRANYNPDGKLGDATTIENTILAFDPKRMLVLKATGFPEGFPFEDAAKGTWSIFYFSAPEPGRTHITVVGLGYTDDPKSVQMRSFFAAANEHSFKSLNRALDADKPAPAPEDEPNESPEDGSGA